ncbi:MAG: 23S rRNA (uracil(1939)-C(5))-methyltransferase RlmD [Candidatus Izimaplasma sp.]|nr:23S rRNA (uracil(1939)-C(5))-methyltransferase RlmD [Candidatus Izimaplasma bacterium]
MTEEKIEKYIVEAVDLTHDGLAVTRLDDGYTVFVEDLLKGETAEIEVIKRRKNFGFGKVITRINRSPYRQAPKCKHFYDCGGCQLMHMDYDVQIAFKRYRIELMLKKIGVEDVEVEDITSMVNPYYYRNKVDIKFTNGENGIKAGYYKSKSHDLVDIEECYIMPKKSFQLLILLKNLLNQYDIKAYDDKTKTGLIKSAVFRESSKHKEIILLLNLADSKLPNETQFVKRLAEQQNELVGLGIAKTDKDDFYLNKPIRLVYGKRFINDMILDIKYRIGFKSFFQVNPVQTERLYTLAIDYANLKKKDKVIDAYCGIGTIALSIANKVYKVFGIEKLRSAVYDAKRNAKMNNIRNAFFEVGDTEEVIQKWKKYAFDALFVDPPRKGCKKKFLQTIVNMKIPKIVYISCNPATLGRDLEYLINNGYKIRKAAPVDMFPQTSHVESIVLLTLNTI